MTDETNPPEPTIRAPKRVSQYLSWAAIGVSVLALLLSALPYLSGGDFGGRVRAYLLANPDVLDEVVAARQAKADAGLADQINAAARANPALLAVDARDPTVGPADAKVTVVEFFDFRCPGCKATAPGVLEMIRSHPDVRFVFKDWAIIDRGDPTGPSHYAARAAQAAHRQGKYLPVFTALMAEPQLTQASIDRILVENGVDLAQAKAVMGSTDVSSHLAATDATAMALRLQGTPTFFINGQASTTIEPADVSRQIAAAKR
jgi:protein-disulfide isomerase